MNDSRRTSFAMCKRAAVLCNAFLWLSPLATAQIGADGGVDSDDVINLSAYEVTASGDKGYATTHSLGGTRINLPLSDAAMGIVNINPALLEDMGAVTLENAVHYVSGVSFTGAQADGRYTIRGRGSSGSKFRDGLPDNFALGSLEVVDTLLFDRIEVIKGPAGLLFGSMNIGGTVNRISKRPLQVNQGMVRTQISSLPFYRFEADYNTVLKQNSDGEYLAFRLVGGIHEGESDDGSPDDRFVINPSLLYRFKDGGALWLYGAYMETNVAKRDTIPGDKEGNLFPHISPGDPYFADSSRRDAKKAQIEIGYTTNFKIFGAPSSIRLVARYNDSEAFRPDSSHSAFDVYDTNGVLIGTNRDILWSEENVGRLDWKQLRQNITWDNLDQGGISVDFTSTFDVGASHHRLFIFGEINEVRTQREQVAANEQLFGFERWPNWELPPDWTSFMDRAIAQGPSSAGDDFGFRLLRNEGSRLTNIAVAAQDNVSFADGRFILIGGVRLDDVTVDNDDFMRETGTRNRATNSTYKYGAVVKPVEGVSIYYNHSETFVPQPRVDNDPNSPSFGEKFPDQEGTNDEIGVKLDLFDSRLVGSIAYFDAELTEQLVGVDLGTGVDTVLQPIGDLSSKGWEFDLSIQPIDSLSLIVSYTDLESITQSGVRPRGSPQKTFAVFGKYSFLEGPLEGFEIAAGLRHAADRAGDGGDTFTTPDLTLANLNLIYKLDDDWRFQLNIDNLFDSTEVTGSITIDRLDVANERNFTFSVTRSF